MFGENAIRIVNGEEIYIVRPKVEDILKPDFDYNDFAQKAIEYILNSDVDLSEFYNGNIEKKSNKKQTELQEYLNQLEDSFHKKIYHLQNQFEIERKTGNIDKINYDITNQMKWLASDYKATLDTLKDEKELDNINEEFEFQHEAISNSQSKSINNQKKLKEEMLKVHAKKVMEGKEKIETLHDAEIHYLKGDTRKKAKDVSFKLNFHRFSTEINKKFKLSEKSFGHRYLILLGANEIDIKGNKTR